VFASRRDKQILLVPGKTGYREGRKLFTAYIEVAPSESARSGFAVSWFKRSVDALAYDCQLYTYPTGREGLAFSVLALSAPSAKELARRIDEVTALHEHGAAPKYEQDAQERLRDKVVNGGRLVVCAQKEGGVS
jgi:hypothetical protein